jgi:hypothetical protein
MASAIDVCNLALAHLGEDPSVSSIDPPEGSAHAEKCKRFYPIARDVALEMRNWSFAMKRVALAELTNDSDAWFYKYALPADCLRAVGVLQPEVTDENQDSSDFVIEGQYLYTNAPEATLRYLYKLTDTTKFSPLFVNAVSWLLASYLAGAICEDKNVKNWCLEMFDRELSLGAQSVANASQTTNTYTASWIGKR